MTKRKVKYILKYDISYKKSYFPEDTEGHMMMDQESTNPYGHMESKD